MRTINIRWVCGENLYKTKIHWILIVFSVSPQLNQFCDNAPELKACRPNQPAYLTLNRIDRLTGARLENTHLLLCKCPVGHILLQDTKNVKFYDFEQQSVQLMHQLCSPVSIALNFEEIYNNFNFERLGWSPWNDEMMKWILFLWNGVRVNSQQCSICQRVWESSIVLKKCQTFWWSVGMYFKVLSLPQRLPL